MNAIIALKKKFKFADLDIAVAREESTGRLFLHAGQIAKAVGFRDATVMIQNVSENDLTSKACILEYPDARGVMRTLSERDRNVVTSSG